MSQNVISAGDAVLDALLQRQRQKEKEEMIREILKDYSLFGKIAFATWQRRKRLPGIWPRRTLRGKENRQEVVIVKALDVPEKHVLCELEISLKNLPGLKDCSNRRFAEFEEGELRKIAKWVFANRRRIW